jgi:aminocarboxymuconate-semialdehyde decarboxylase
VSAVVDAHAHVIVPEILRGDGGEEWRPRVRREDGAQIVELGGREIRSMIEEVVDVEAILAERERRGIEGVVLCPWVPLLYAEAEADAALERCRIQNRSLEAMVSAGAGRVHALGAVPMQDPDLAAAELRDIAAAGGLSGVEISASVGGVYVGDDHFERFWEAVAEAGLLVFIHPTTRAFGEPVFAHHYLWNTVGNPFETTIAAAQMVMAGVMERHGELRVLLAHGGGALPALRGRLRHSHTFQPDARSRLTESPLESIRRFYFDTVTHDAHVLRSLVDWAGADRVLLGSDYPFDMADPDPVGSVRALRLGDAAERAVLGGNAEGLMTPAGQVAG